MKTSLLIAFLFGILVIAGCAAVSSSPSDEPAMAGCAITPQLVRQYCTVSDGVVLKGGLNNAFALQGSEECGVVAKGSDEKGQVSVITYPATEKTRDSFTSTSGQKKITGLGDMSVLERDIYEPLSFTIHVIKGQQGYIFNFFNSRTITCNEDQATLIARAVVG